MANYDLTYEGSRVQGILDTGNSLKDAGYIFRGEATPSTVPGTPTERVAYIGGPGTYTNFGSSITVGAGCICVFKYTGSAWSNQVINTGLDSAVNTLQSAITAINNNIGNGYVYAGVATPSTSPVTGKVFYLAVQAGTYTNFGNAVVTAGLNVIKYNGSVWSVDQVIAIDAEPTQGSANLVKSGGVLNSIIQNGPAFDLSAYNAQGGVLATYADLSAALTALNALPAAYKKGGMSFKFVQSSDNKYVQFRLMADSFNTTPANWQGVDDEPTSGSDNLVKSGGIHSSAVAPFVLTAINTSSSGGSYRNNNGKVEFVELSSAFKYLQIQDLTPYSIIEVSNADSYNDVYNTFITDDEDNVLATFITNNTVSYRIVLSDYSGASRLYVSSYDTAPVVKLQGKYYSYNCNPFVNGDDFINLCRYGFCTINNNKAAISVNYSWRYYCITNIEKYSNIYYDGRVRSAAYQILTDSDDNVLWSSQNNDNHILDITKYPSASKFYFCNETVELSEPILKGLQDSLLQQVVNKENNEVSYNKTIYIAPNGNDSNDGLTSSTPKQTVDAALDAGATTILCLFGLHNAIYKQKIDLSKAKNNYLTISPAEGVEEVVFVGDNSLVTESEEKVEGYTYVYSSDYTDVSALIGQTLYMYDVPDENTLISDSERHSVQKGREYRMMDLLLTYVSSINDVDTNSAYRFTVDENTNKIYFNRPSSIPVNPYHPLFKRCVSNNAQETLFINNDKVPNLKLTMANVSVKFVTLNINNLINPKLIECSGGYASAYAMGQGSITFHSSVGAELIRCEAYGNDGGDGFSGHGIGGFSNVTATLIDCWSHDNDDDGISTHYGGKLTIIGGLFEYNGKAGVTPAVTTQCTCHNVYSRQNYTGFMVLNAGGVTAIRNCVCYNCIAENNNRGIYNGTTINHTGFLSKDEGSNMLLVNCKSIGDEYGYKAEAGTTMRLIDCSASGNTTVKSGDGTIIINNTSSVS